MTKSQTALGAAIPAARTIEGTGAHYGWTRTSIYNWLGEGKLNALKAGRRTLITTESAERLFHSLPRAQFRAKPQRVEQNQAA